MPAPTNVPEFLDLVRKSGLVPDGRFDEMLDRYRAAGNLPAAIDQTAALLVREGLLTFFQAKQLKLGRYKRFTIGSKYRLLELIGAGGMGAVYLCEHTLMRRLVALKVLPVEKLDDPSSLDRFYREARAVAALDHPNIVRAYDIDQFEKLHFLVMEYVDGTSLQEIVARHGPMDPLRAANYITQSAVGLQHAHELGMVHRDVKPGNLLLERTGIIKILDMGLARFFNKTQDNLTEKYDEKCVLGTADYLAPEQAVSSTVDIRADIYSLGGTLYFLLTGQTPFPDGTIAAKLVAHQTKDPRPVEQFRKDVPTGMLEVLRRMMAKDPDERYQTPIEVADALAEWADQPVGAPPAREMPGLCPLVLGLTAHTLSRSGPIPTLARSLPASGRGSSVRSGPGSGAGSGSGRNPRAAAPGVSTAPYEKPAGSNSNPRQRTAAPNSTARASGARTTPIPPRPPSSSRVAIENQVPKDPAGGSSVVIVVSHRRTALFVALGVLAGLIVAVGGVAAYLAIRGG
jgi:serine/threonine protein kinase